MNNFKELKNLKGDPIRRCRDTSTIGFNEGMYMMKTCLELTTTSSIIFNIDSGYEDQSTFWKLNNIIENIL